MAKGYNFVFMRIEMNKLNKIAGVWVLAGTLTGCSSFSERMEMEDGGSFELRASSPEAMRAYGETLSGLVVTGKASPDMEDAYFKSRNAHYEQKTTRVKARLSLRERMQQRGK